ALCDGVYGEAGAPAEEQLALRDALGGARAQLGRIFPSSLVAADGPFVIFCRSPDCKVAFGAPPEASLAADIGVTRPGLQTADGFIGRPTVIVTAGVAATPRILLHELVHAELARRIPYDALPTWFNEGLATMIADEPRCAEGVPPSID